MKTSLLLPILSLGLSGLPIAGTAQIAPTAATAADTGLRFNFRGAPLETVLNYMSDAAGFVIVLETPVKGTVDMWSSQPVSREEAVQLLNVALNKNGYAASVQGRSLIVTSKDEARKKNIPIHTGNDPAEIPLTAEMVMQIIPLSHIDATQAATDLGSLLPASASLTANKDSNSLIVTDTQINVHHIVEIVAALDTSVDTVSAIKVFKLKNADPYEMAQLLTSLFATPASTQSTGNDRSRFLAAFAGGGFPGGGGGGSGGGGRGNRSSSSGNNRGTTTSGLATQVIAVADPRTFSVVVTAGKTQMPEIGEMIAKLDTSSARKQKVFVYTLENADVKQVESILKNLFQSSNSRASTSTEVDPLSTRASNNSQTTATTPSLSIGGTGSRSR